MLLAEYARDTTSFDGFVLVEAGVALATLQLAWRQQERIRLVPLLALATLFHAAWIALHLGLSLPNDYDSSIVYRREGEALLHGHYPRSEYPVGAVLLFAFEAWIGNGVTRTANAFAMMPFQFATVLCVWGLRTRFSSWFAVLIALWPANMLWFELRFDLVPAACLCAGLLLVLRRHWVWAGIAFGLGTVFKWSPSLAFLVIAVWLFARSRKLQSSSPLPSS